MLTKGNAIDIFLGKLKTDNKKRENYNEYRYE